MLCDYQLVSSLSQFAAQAYASTLIDSVWVEDMSYRDDQMLRRWREDDPAPKSPLVPPIPPGRRTLTMKLPAQSAAVPAPVQRRHDSAIDANRKETDALIAHWTNAAVRPDLFDASGPQTVPLSTSGPTAVQMKARGNPHADDVHELATEGIAGSATSLPFLEQIQRSFGVHGVSGIQSHTGGPATAACEGIGASAYATGDHVAFREAPDLHTVAHEAAHVVQQRAGVQLMGRVGKAGDEYERNADQVADAVVAGESAECLLSRMAPNTVSVGSGNSVQLKPKLGSGEDAFDEMWAAHPHNDQDDESQNTSSDDVRTQEGLPDYLDNTCAIRLSVMLNATGNKITPATAKAAGLKRKPHYSKKTKDYYILAANEMWQYLEKHFRKEDAIFPATGKYKDEQAFQTEFESTIKPVIAVRKGIAAFDKIFDFSGTGHVDLFDGERLSDAPNWYPCQRLRLWYIVVP